MNKAPGKLNVYVNQKYHDLDKVIKTIESSGEDPLMDTYCTAHDFNGVDGYVLVGTAEVHVTLLPKKEVVAKQVEAMQETLRQHRAESQKKENFLLDSISKLTAIEYSEVV